MASIRRILVAVKDLRAGGRSLVRKAAQIASASGAALELFHCLTEPIAVDFSNEPAYGLEAQQRSGRARAAHQLERIASALRALHPRLKVEVAVEWDAPIYDAIVRRAVKIKADLIVASAHAGSHVLPGLMRLTDWELVRLSPMPLLLVRSKRAYRRPAVLVAVDPTHAFSKPLQLDDALLRSGGQLARNLRGTLHAVHAYARVPGGAIPPDALAINDYSLKKIEASAARAARIAFEQALKGTDIKPARRYLIGRHPIDAILQAARKSRCAIVVMGAVSRSGFKRLLIGNTAERMLDELPCDVLVVKPTVFKSRVPRAVQGPRLLMPTAAPWPGSY